MPEMSTFTPYGRALRTSDGWLHITAAPDELATWAYRTGWPCATLPACAGDVTAEYDPRGNLVNTEHPGAEDIPAHELAAWVADVCKAAGIVHPATGETPARLASRPMSPEETRAAYWNSPAGRASLAAYPETPRGPTLYPYFGR